MSMTALVMPFSVDWEDWFQVCCAPFDGPDAFSRFADRLAQNTELTLTFCEQLGIQATWFCLADQAKRHPECVRRILQAGHRIGLHGNDHRRAFTMPPEVFTEWLKAGRQTLEDLTGEAVLGFRAPEWSLRGRAVTYWRHVQAAGFLYDSSRAPLAKLGKSHWPRQVHALDKDFFEFPPPVAVWRAGIRLPLWGCGMRALPTEWLRQEILELASSGAGTPLVLHPWELDEAQPTLRGAPFYHRFVHGVGLKGVSHKLQEVLKGVGFMSIESWMEKKQKTLMFFVYNRF